MQTRDVTLETSWPSIYHDLMAQGLKVARRPVALRTQSKNAARESDKFSPRHPFLRAGMRVSYTGQQVLATPSKTIMEVMCDVTGTSFAVADFSLPVPDEWTGLLWRTLPPLRLVEKPWMFLRPLVARPEWRGGTMRNADPASYVELYNRVRDKFFVISVADLADGQEWLVGPEMKADLVLHKGELVFEALAALAKCCELVFTSSGFAAVLGPAVGTPTISIVGGYEDPRCHDAGKRHAPYLAIGPRVPCSCWTASCRKVCDKQIDIVAATKSIDDFVSENCIQISDSPCPVT